MIVRAHTHHACILTTLNLLGGRSGAPTPPSTIGRSVGRNSANQSNDVKTVQRLFNRIAVADGGPEDLLAEDGFIGPLTLGTIARFQKHHGTGSDARIDPGGPTLAKMNAVAGDRDPQLAQISGKDVDAHAYHGIADGLFSLFTVPTLPLRTARSLPQVRDTARKALRTAELAADHLRGGLGGARPWRLAQLHFALDRVPRARALTALADIQVTFRRVLTVLTSRPGATGGDPFGLSIFEIDRTGTSAVAYSPAQAAEPRRQDPNAPHAGRVYLGSAAARLVPDHFEHVLLHELLHFIDEETTKRVIGDLGYRDRAFQLPHEKRMRNADNYALFASHAFLGRARLVASQPAVAPHVPDDL
ncbi:hypothetical protein HLB44_02250 [Aquincola sp. S2]|uniref:Peptidoglycan binding-like domain-containing protein n=1 Tax=Pseudaquabacterium terrae TaxID=2732868 RepID=A0ABX2ED17_9BURK|nr:hypothetical protein [Aquabacterium terrae]NRF65800.1 hypothetical protein [Aquabacterium terrae]